jgi:hypothetical protein
LVHLCSASPTWTAQVGHADWIEDTLFERERRRREAELGKRGDTLRGWLKAVVEAGQSWFVVSLVGAFVVIGFLRLGPRLTAKPLLVIIQFNFVQVLR